MELPIISLWMPWAQWVDLGWKKIETRTHYRFSGLVDRRIGIHAAMTWDKDAIGEARPYLTEYQRRQSENFERLGGRIICTATVGAFRELDGVDSKDALIDCHLTKRYGLILADVHHLREPILCRGKQGIWYHEIP